MLVATYPTKKALKDSIGKPLQYQETSHFGIEYKRNGNFPVVGPGAYDRKWYAEVMMVDGKIVRVK